MADADLFAQFVAARDIELGIDKRTNEMIRQVLRRLILGRRFRPALALGVFPSRRPVLVVLDHGQRLAVIDREHRHVLVVKLFLLIVAENNRDIGVGLLQRIAQVFHRFQASFIALAKLLRRELTGQIPALPFAARPDSPTADRSRPFLADDPNPSRVCSTADCATCRYR